MFQKLKSVRFSPSLLVKSVILAGALAMGITIVVRIVQKVRGNAMEVVPVTVYAISASKAEYVESDEFSSYTESGTMAPAVSYLAGKLMKLNVESGDVVNEDDVLAVIDDEQYNLVLAQAEAGLAVAKSTFARVEGLFKSDSVSKQSYDEAKAQYDVCKSQYDGAALQVSYTRVKAPVGGTVLTLLAKQGETMAAGTPVAFIGNLDDLVATVRIPEKMLGSFSAGMPCKVVSKVSGQEVDGAITVIEPYVDARTKTFKLKVAFDVPPAMRDCFVPGSAIKVRIIKNRIAGADVIPRKCLSSENTIYTVDNEGFAHLVQWNFAANDEYIRIPAGHAGDRFVIKGQNNLYDGLKVGVREAF